MNTQTEVQHTPGPWKISRCSDSREIISHTCGITFRIASADSGLGRANGDNEARANARLIASAPDMLEMLYTVLPSVEESDEFNKPSKKLGPIVRALISKAEGRI